MSWVVAKFVTSNEIEVLPEKWLLADKQSAVYPPNYPRSRLEKAIRTEEEPSSNWKCFEVKLMTSKIYKNFLKASAIASKACITSDLSESEKELPAKRQRKTRELSSSEEENEEESSLDDFPIISASKYIYLLRFTRICIT